MKSFPTMTDLELEISNPCNEKCIHCYRTCKNTKKGFLSARQAESVFSQAKALGASRVTITGGEMLLNSEWKDIVRIADSLDFRISLFSNGTRLTEKDADFIRGIQGVKNIQISLYALDETVHDLIAGVKGACVRTKNAISILRNRNLPLFVSCPVMKENRFAVLDVMKWCDDNEIQSCADVFIFGASDYSGRNLEHRLDRNDLYAFFDETMKDNGRLSYVWGKKYEHKDLTKIKFYGNAVSSLCISGDGQIYPSIGWYEPLGNIDNDSLEKIYKNHPLLRKIRSIAAADIKECLNCSVADYCEFCPIPHLTANKGELFKLDTNFCDYVRLRELFVQKRDSILQNTAATI